MGKITEKKEPASRLPVSRKPGADFTENRREPRYHSLAGIRIAGYEGRALLKDINSGGLCLQSRTFVSLTEGEEYVISITPENGMEPFDLVVGVRWVRSDITHFEAGLAIEKPPSHTAIEKYIGYLKTHSKAG